MVRCDPQLLGRVVLQESYRRLLLRSLRGVRQAEGLRVLVRPSGGCDESRKEQRLGLQFPQRARGDGHALRAQVRQEQTLRRALQKVLRAAQQLAANVAVCPKEADLLVRPSWACRAYGPPERLQFLQQCVLGTRLGLECRADYFCRAFLAAYQGRQLGAQLKALIMGVPLHVFVT